jgi:universal stress protein A
MNAKKILLPTDFSMTGRACLTLASRLARESGATLVILHVQEPSLVHGANELCYAFPDPDRESLLKRLEEVASADPTVHCEQYLVLGDPAAEILRMAEDENVDLIVMGTHGRKGLSRLIMGSVAEAVMRRATCPVLTLKQSAAHAAALQTADELQLVDTGSGI